MDKFLYCLDENMKKNLQSQGFKLINETNIGGVKCWVFENSKHLIFYVQNTFNQNKTKYLFGNIMRF